MSEILFAGNFLFRRARSAGRLNRKQRFYIVACLVASSRSIPWSLKKGI
jgi:hypothetical protein